MTFPAGFWKKHLLWPGLISGIVSAAACVVAARFPGYYGYLLLALLVSWVLASLLVTPLDREEIDTWEKKNAKGEDVAILPASLVIFVGAIGDLAFVVKIFASLADPQTVAIVFGLLQVWRVGWVSLSRYVLVRKLLKS